MKATVHPVDGVPGPQDNSWVDAVLTALGAEAIPAGALIARPLGVGPGAVVAFWTDDAPVAGCTAGPVTVGPGVPYEIASHQAGTSAGPARYLQLTTFGGRGDEWCAAFDRSGQERVWPAVKDVPGLVGVLVGAAPGARVAVTLADSVEALEAGAAAILSTELLPWEDPAHLTGPEQLAILRLVHADVPAGATR
ncbi:MAG TPA: hypothetical protein VGP36_20550 [Mycobacteriales bacterium]|jgi:hypothetical protein|nr:hypothetical protein [Mycobacteriales bacterium]